MSLPRVLGFAFVFATAAVLVTSCGDDGGANTSPQGDGGPGADGTLPDGASPPTPAEFGLDVRPSNTTCKAPARPPSTVPVTFQRVYQNVNLNAPMAMAQMPGDPSRWFVALRGAPAGSSIVSFASQSPGNTPKTVASVGAMGGVNNGEGGILGMAFHPKCTPQSCKLFISWTPAGGQTGIRSEVGYFTSTNNGETFGSYTPVLGPFSQPFTNHNGGGLAFGKDGYLYISFGDGGGGDDPQANGQRKETFFSKILRIDVDDVPPGATYGIPDGNPFKNGGGEPATFAWGFRNPFRISIDRETGDVWTADVGQNNYEEVNRVELGGNYGWPCREGLHDNPASTAQKCPSKVGLIDPLFEHQHVPANSRSITGGVVYRGKAMPALSGTYIYGDFEQQDLFALSFDPTTGEPAATKLNDQGNPASGWVYFAEDLDGEVYAVGLNDGAIWKMVPAPGAPTSTFPDRLSKTGCVDPADPKTPASGLVPFGVNAQLWSDGADKDRWMALPDQTTITVNADGDFSFPRGTVLVKTFKIGGKPVETRLFIHHDDGVWAGYSYEWLDDGSDAVLLPSSKRKQVGAQSWYFPSRSDCARCHTEAAGRSLGLELGQQNGDFVYASTNRISNQLTTLEHIGMFSAPLGKPAAELAVIPDPSKDGPGEARARAYLHANCSNCHRPEGGGRGDMDLRFSGTLAATQTCNADGQAGDLGVAGAKLIVPGDPTKSLVSLRPRALGAMRMPPLASAIVDTGGLDVVDSWIKDIAGCP